MVRDGHIFFLGKLRLIQFRKQSHSPTREADFIDARADLATLSAASLCTRGMK